MASTQAIAERRARAHARLRAAADEAQARHRLAIGEPATTKDAEIDRIQWIEYAATILEAIGSASSPTDAPDAPAETKSKRK